MGESFSMPSGYTEDTRYNNARETFKHSDKETQKMVEEFLHEQKRLKHEKEQLQRKIQDLRCKLNMVPHHNAKPQQENVVHGNATDNRMLLGDCLQGQEKLQRDNERLTRENKKLMNENRILSNEKESALTRLSKIAGIQLTKGNSGIVDLSDVNRPTKLAEKWSSLYTDEWTEAYDQLTLNVSIKSEDCEIEKKLCYIAMKCYQICQDIERKQMTDIKTHTWDIACCLQQQPDQLVSCLKTSLYNTVTKEDPTKKFGTMDPKQHAKMGGQIHTEVVAIHKCMEELLQIVHERRKYDKQLLKYVTQETVRYFEKYAKPDSKVLKFVQRCTELCWSMVIKEPPMVLVHDQMEGKSIDHNLFSVYTKRGSVVEFVVWPALILNKNGPILSKGVVQGKENKKQETAEMKHDVKTETVEGDELSEEDALVRTMSIHAPVGDDANDFKERKQDVKTKSVKGDELSEEGALVRTMSIHAPVGDDANDFKERKHDVKTETVKGDELSEEDALIRTIVHVPVGDKANDFQFKGNGNSYEQ